MKLCYKGLIGLFASLSLLLNACGSEDLTDYLTREYEDYTGEFKSLGGVKVNEKITHLFETDDGEILYSYSDRYDLDDEAYFGKRVDAYGSVSTYEELDKAIFEVKRITEASELEEESEEVTEIEHKDAELGFSLTYPNNWTLKGSVGSVIFEAPAGESTETPDYVYIAELDAALEKTGEDSQEDRATEVRDYVSANYSDLAGLSSELSYIGTDRLFGVRYKTEDGDTLYFISRGTELLELSYYHETESDDDRLNNGNTFSTMVSSFRFTTTPSDSEAEPSATEEESEEKEPEGTSSSTSADQITFSKYLELESKSFEFKMSYPSTWFYDGSSGTGYNFNDDPIAEDSSESVIVMVYNQSTQEGASRTDSTFSVTVEEAGRFYTFKGPAEYESVMQTMADSIVSTKVEE